MADPKNFQGPSEHEGEEVLCHRPSKDSRAFVLKMGGEYGWSHRPTPFSTATTTPLNSSTSAAACHVMPDHPVSFELYRNPKQPRPRPWRVRELSDIHSVRSGRRHHRRVFRQRCGDALLGAFFAAIPLLILLAL